MSKSIRSMSALAALGFMVTSAEAVTFTPPSAGSYNFGEVVVGQTGVINLTVDILYFGFEIAKLITVNDFSTGYMAGTGTCESGSKCSLKFTYTPTAPTPTSGKIPVGILSLNISSILAVVYTAPVPNLAPPACAIGDNTSCNDKTSSFGLTLSGSAIAPAVVPLPAAFPLLGGALSLLGLFGWRRNRIAVA